MLRRIPPLFYLSLSWCFFQPLWAQDSASPAATPAATGLEFIQQYAAAAEAFRAGDDAAMVAAARMVLEQWPDHAGARYLFAVGRARQGWLGDAASALQRLAEQGLTTRLEAEPAFAPILKEAGYADLRRQLQSNRLTSGESQRVYQLQLEQFIPEGLARQPDGGLLLGSVHQAQIVAIAAEQAAQPEPETRLWASGEGLCSVLSLRVNQRGDQVYAATACMPQTAGLAPERLGHSGIFVYSAAGQLLAQHWLPADEQQHVLGDVIEYAPGQLITSDSLGGGIYRLDLASGEYHALVAPGLLPNPQGLAPAADGRVYVADYQAGIFTFRPSMAPDSQAPPAASGYLQRLANPSMAALHGIDGLVRCGNELLAVQNGLRPNRIIALSLDARGNSIENSQVLARGLVEWDEPTQAISDGDGLLYVANSHWPQFNSDGTLSTTALDGPRLMRIERPACATAPRG